MLRVWMALSAVWVTFWLIIVAVIVLTSTTSDMPVQLPSLLTLIVATPPFLLLAIGALSRWIFETYSRLRSDP